MSKLAFHDDEQLKSAIVEAATTFAPPAGLKESMRNWLVDAERNSEAKRAVPVSRVKGFRRWLVAAAAAILIVAGVVFINSGPTLENVAYAELAAALKNAPTAEWIHYHEGSREFWISFHPYCLGSEFKWNRRG